MLSERVLIDTGAFAAMFDPRDRYHQLCANQFQALPIGKAYTCWPVITEAAYLARRHHRQRDEFLNGVEAGDFALLELRESDITGIRATLSKYRDQDIDLADAAIIHLANREDIRAIFTLDRRHFNVYRRIDGQPFHLLPDGVP